MSRKGSNNSEKKTTASSRRKEEFLKSINRVRHSYDSKEQCWSKVAVSLLNVMLFRNTFDYYAVSLLKIFEHNAISPYI
jgi:hypothetical protein